MIPLKKRQMLEYLPQCLYFQLSSQKRLNKSSIHDKKLYNTVEATLHYSCMQISSQIPKNTHICIYTHIYIYIPTSSHLVVQSLENGTFTQKGNWTEEAIELNIFISHML